MNCYSCDQSAVNACKRCAKPYCEDHGNATYCADCLRPASAMPSFNLYRVALLVMLVGTAVAVFLILKPPGEQNGASAVVVGGSGPTPSGGSAQATVPVETPSPDNGTGTSTTTASGTTTPGVPPQSSGDEETATAAAESGTATPATSATEDPFGEHVIVDGDTLFGIAEDNLPAGDDPVSFAKAIANLNGLDYDNPVLTVGKTLLLPKPASQ